MAQADTSSPSPSQKKSIAVIDDDTNVTLLITQSLAHFGHPTTSFHSADAFLSAHSDPAAAFHLIVTDHNMHGMSGMDLVHHLRAANCLLPVILVSGYSMKLKPPEREALQPLIMLLKPFSLKEMMDSIQTLLPPA